MVVRPHRHIFEDHRPLSHASEGSAAGALGGLIGGSAMALGAMLYDAVTGHGFWTPLRAIASTVLGHTAVDVGAPAILLGLLIHAVVSVVIGVVFAAITPRDMPPAAAMVFGMFAGLTVLVMMSLVVLPFVNHGARARLMWGSDPRSLPVVVAFAIHVLYGLGLALVPYLRRLVLGRARN